MSSPSLDILQYLASVRRQCWFVGTVIERQPFRPDGVSSIDEICKFKIMHVKLLCHSNTACGIFKCNKLTKEASRKFRVVQPFACARCDV